MSVTRWLVVLAAFTALVAEGRAQTAARKPNIVLIVADDLGYGDTSGYGGPDIPTPNIDSIASRGIRFTDAYVTAPVCSPSRAGFLTGRYQQQFGHEYNPVGPPADPNVPLALPLSETTVAQRLKSAGYTTGIIGKWHMGMQPRYHPLDRGFDEFYGMPSGHPYIETAKPGVHAFEVPGEAEIMERQAARGARLFRGRSPVQEEGYITEAFGREAVDFIERRRSAPPFFLYLAFNAPHVPLRTTQKYYDRFPKMPESRRIYAAMISALDDAIGTVLAKLDSGGLAGDTLVIFLSDNGCPDYIDCCTNTPLKGSKRMLYEGGIRIPFAVRWNGSLGAGKVYSQAISSLDLAPTLMAVAGVKRQEQDRLDGVDLMPYLTGGKTGAPHDVLFWRMGPNAAVRAGKWKLLKAGDRLVRLYDLSVDRGEKTDLSAKQPQVVADLSRRLAAWQARLVPPLWPARTATSEYGGDKIEWHF
jgi:arylsulfatase A-like enzyme